MVLFAMLIVIFGRHIPSEQLFSHALRGYLKYAYPADELNPITCSAKDPKYGTDVMGNYTLSLIDSLTTAITMRQPKRLIRLMDLLKLNNFDLNSTVSVFEVTIRVLGALTSTALLLKDDAVLSWISNDTAIRLKLSNYFPRLLNLSMDLGERLLVAFDTETGIPPSKVNLKYGIPLFNVTSPIRSHNIPQSHRVTNPAAAGTLLLEFGMLSELTNNMTFYNYAKRSLIAALNTRSNIGLFGNEININGNMLDVHHSIGGGIDSLYEYLFKAWIVFNDESLLDLFFFSYQQLFKYNAFRSHSQYFLKFNKQCFVVQMPQAFHLNVHAKSANMLIARISGLAAFFPGLQTLVGDVNTAFFHLLVYVRLLEIYPFVPESFNINTHNVEFNMYLLRPEVYESMVFVSNAFVETRPVLQALMSESINRLNYYCKTKCGYANLNNLLMGKKTGRMESYFLSETAKYMYLMFHQNHLFLSPSYTFTTEGHPVKILDWKKQTSMFPLFNITNKRILKLKNNKICPIAKDPYLSLINITTTSFGKYIIMKKIRRIIRKSYKKVLFDH